MVLKNKILCASKNCVNTSTLQSIQKNTDHARWSEWFCRKCRKTYTFANYLTWNVAKARNIVGDGRNPHPIPTKELEGCVPSLKENRIHPFATDIENSRVAKADLTLPGITVFLIDSYWLIDGHHRLTKALLNGEPFFQLYTLTKEESDRCLAKGDKRKITELRKQIELRTEFKTLTKKESSNSALHS